jgi:hypothetical protein
MEAFQFSVCRLLGATALFGVAMAFYIQSAELGDHYIQCLAVGIVFTVAGVGNLFRRGWIATLLVFVLFAPVLFILVIILQSTARQSPMVATPPSARANLNEANGIVKDA